MIATDLKPGDVLWYSPEGGTHARECLAFVREDGRVVDTFWHDFDRGSSSYHLRDVEIERAELRFNVNDYEAFDRYDRTAAGRWETYHPDDRARISSQHNLQEVLFIRKGATPDLGTKIKNAQARVAEAESDVRSAQHCLEWRRKDLADLLLEQGSSGAER